MTPKPEACRPCPLYAAGKGFVPDRYVPGAAVLALFRNPGKHEVEGRMMVGWKGREQVFEPCPPQPLTGATGYTLAQKYLPLAGLSRDEISLANCIRCRPHDSDDLPSAYELRDAIAYCQSQHFHPPASTRLYVAAGEHAMYALTGLLKKGEDQDEEGRGWSLRYWRGWLHPLSPCQTIPRWRYTDVYTPTATETPVLITYHLAALFKMPWNIPLAQRDWQKVGQVLAGQWPVAPPPIEPLAPTRWPALAAVDTEYNPDTGEFLRYSMAYTDIRRQTHVHVVEAAEARPLPSDGQSTLIYHNAEVDLPYIDPLVPPDTQLEDTMILHSVLWPDLAHDLNTLGSLYSPFNRWKHLADTNQRLYAGLDAAGTWWAFYGMLREIAGDPVLKNIYYLSRLPLVRLIRHARSRPTKVNQAAVRDALSRLEGRKYEATLMAHAALGWPINLGSPKQVSGAL